MTACRLILSLAARASSSRNMPSVKSTLTRLTGRTTVNLLVKYAEMSFPCDAMSAISSAVGAPGLTLDVLGIDTFFLFGRLPGCDQVIVLALGIVPDFEDDGTQQTAAPTDCTKLFRIIVLLVNLYHADARCRANESWSSIRQQTKTVDITF